MRFGVCAGIDKAFLLAEAGCDYIELGVSTDLVPEANPAAWAEKRRAIETMPLPPEAFNFLIKDAKITGPEADFDRLERYMHTALERAAQVGGKVIVFGSGGSRRVPDGFSHEEAEQQILRFLHLCADAAEENGVVVVIEPLNRGESNIINSVADGARLARLVNRPGLRNLADTYHMEVEKEPLSDISANADVLAHTHTADVDRHAPVVNKYDYVALFKELLKAGYAGRPDARISIECNWKDFASEVRPSVAVVKKAWEEAKSAP